MAVLLVGIDGTIVNVALPTIRRDLGASLSGSQWIIDAYALVLASLMMLSGSLADRLGSRRVFLGGLVVFTVGSGLCAVAPTLDVLIAARALQAIGGSVLTPLALSIIRRTFPDPEERSRAIGTWGAMTGVSMATGPVLGGVLVDGPGWRFIFLVNLPIGALTLLAALRMMPPASRTSAASPQRVDLVGQVLVIVTLVALTFSIIEGAHRGFGSVPILISSAIAVLGAITFVAWERAFPAPLVDLRFFASLPFSGAAAMSVLLFASAGGFMLLTQLYLQSARGLSALDAGLFSLPMAASTVILAPWSSRRLHRVGARWLLIGGGLFRILPPLLFIDLDLSTPIWLIAFAFLLNGAGMGLLNTPISTTAVSGMPPAQAGVAAAITSTTRQIGFALGVAVVGVVLGARGSHLSGGRLAGATHAGWFVMMGVGGVIALIGAAATTQRARQSALAEAEELELA